MLCYTLMGRKVYYFEAYKSEEKIKTANLRGKKVIVLCARVHPGDACSSYVMKGFLERFLQQDNNEGAAFLRNHFYFLIVPMLNPDGVSIGNSRCSFSGNDLNQVWSNPDRFIHPEIFYTKKLLLKLKKENDLIFFTEFQASYNKKGAFIQGCHLQSNARATREFPFLLDSLMPLFSYANCK